MNKLIAMPYSHFTRENNKAMDFHCSYGTSNTLTLSLPDRKNIIPQTHRVTTAADQLMTILRKQSQNTVPACCNRLV